MIMMRVRGRPVKADLYYHEFKAKNITCNSIESVDVICFIRIYTCCTFS